MLEMNSRDSRRESVSRLSTGSGTAATITDISNANVELILGLRKLGGRILTSDPGSLSEVTERSVLMRVHGRGKGSKTLQSAIRSCQFISKPILPTPREEVDGAEKRKFSGNI